MEIKYAKVDELVPYENNPRVNDSAVEPVAESIRKFGFKVPIVVDKNLVVVAGHTRLKAAQLLGLREVPCIVASDLDDEQVRAFRLADNKVGELAQWDFELLGVELGELPEWDMEVFGFDEDFLDGVDFGAVDDVGEGDVYTGLVEGITYEPSSDPPTVDILVDTAKADELVEEIRAADLDEGVREFLMMAATRHLVFSYAKIADFYAHADKKVQELMEKSGLVIIDFEQAVENGFVELSEKVERMRGEDNER